MSLNKAHIRSIYHEMTVTISYIVYDEPHGHAAIIDPVLDYNPGSSATCTSSVEPILEFIAEQGLTVDWILETHAHADHFSAAHYLKEKVGGKIAIGKHIKQVQKTFKDLLNLENSFATDGSQFDHLFEDNEVFSIGKLSARALSVPGHTPADIAYKIGDAIFVGDTLFMPDVGTGRCDFPGGDAQMMYQSIRKILSYPDNTRLFMCHDYPPVHRSPYNAKWESTVGEQRLHNIHVNDTVDEANFVNHRNSRDAKLSMPKLILPAIQINIRAGQLPQPENNGISYLKIPLNLFESK